MKLVIAGHELTVADGTNVCVSPGNQVVVGSDLRECKLPGNGK